MAELWTIDALGDAVSAALAVGYEGAPSGRVRDVPDRRTIRYYTTLGLIDRPAEMRGRTALYGRKHLLQLVAIKRLQSRGLTLAEVQAELAGASTKVLKAIAAIPEEAPEAAAPITERAEETGRRSEAFWGSLPSDAEVTEKILEDDGEEEVLQTGIPISDDVLLLFSPGRTIDRDDLALIREAARPLVHFLSNRGLLASPMKGEKQ